VEDVASPEGFEADPAMVWRFYSQRRAAALTCSPNPGHLALVEIEKHLGDRFWLVTQNVEGLHHRAGSHRVIELHGNLFTSKCSSCARPPFADETVYPDGEVPRCDGCQGSIRPDIVWFGEAIDARHMKSIFRFMTRGTATGKLVFLAAGTSGVVHPAAGLVDQAARMGAETFLVNAEPAENIGSFGHYIAGKSGEVLPSIWRF
jgi:NAD-dependent deacetylase